MMKQEDIVGAIHASTVDVFETMLGWNIEKEAVFMETHAPGPSDGIITVVGLAGAWVGTASICCSASLACRISSAMLGSAYATVDDDVLDAMAEVSNMIIGNFKNAAEDYLGPLGLSIPTVFYGLGFSARTAGKEKWIVAPFRCDSDIFEVKICLTLNRGLAHIGKVNPTLFSELGTTESSLNV